MVINHAYAPDFYFELPLTFFHYCTLLMASMLVFSILAVSLAAGTPVLSDKVHPLKPISSTKAILIQVSSPAWIELCGADSFYLFSEEDANW